MRVENILCVLKISNSGNTYQCMGHVIGLARTKMVKSWKLPNFEFHNVTIFRLVEIPSNLNVTIFKLVEIPSNHNFTKFRLVEIPSNHIISHYVSIICTSTSRIG